MYVRAENINLVSVHVPTRCRGSSVQYVWRPWDQLRPYRFTGRRHTVLRGEELVPHPPNPNHHRMLKHSVCRFRCTCNIPYTVFYIWHVEWCLELPLIIPRCADKHTCTYMCNSPSLASSQTLLRRRWRRKELYMYIPSLEGQIGQLWQSQTVICKETSNKLY